MYVLIEAKKSDFADGVLTSEKLEFKFRDDKTLHIAHLRVERVVRVEQVDEFKQTCIHINCEPDTSLTDVIRMLRNPRVAVELKTSKMMNIRRTSKRK